MKCPNYNFPKMEEIKDICIPVLQGLKFKREAENKVFPLLSLQLKE